MCVVYAFLGERERSKEKISLLSFDITNIINSLCSAWLFVGSAACDIKRIDDERSALFRFQNIERSCLIVVEQSSSAWRVIRRTRHVRRSSNGKRVGNFTTMCQWFEVNIHSWLTKFALSCSNRTVICIAFEEFGMSVLIGIELHFRSTNALRQRVGWSEEIWSLFAGLTFKLVSNVWRKWNRKWSISSIQRSNMYSSFRSIPNSSIMTSTWNDTYCWWTR